MKDYWAVSTSAASKVFCVSWVTVCKLGEQEESSLRSVGTVYKEKRGIENTVLGLASSPEGFRAGFSTSAPG